MYDRGEFILMVGQKIISFKQFSYRTIVHFLAVYYIFLFSRGETLQSPIENSHYTPMQINKQIYNKRQGESYLIEYKAAF